MDVPTAAATLSAHASDVASWAHRKGLTVSIPKSHSTLFTPHTHQSRTDPHVIWAGSDLTLCRTPKILGVTFDPHYTFSPHIGAVCERARSRLNILKSLAGTSWGQQKETITITFKSLIKVPLHVCRPHLVPQLIPFFNSQTSNNTERSTQDGHRGSKKGLRLPPA